MNKYDRQAEDFCKKHGVIIKSECIELVRGFPNGQDDMWHFKFKVTVKRKKSRSQMTFDFYGSYYDCVNNVQKLSDYEVLACLASDSYCPDNIDDFIQEFGYEVRKHGDYTRIGNIFKACKKQCDGIHRVLGDCLDDLREIQ